MGRDQDDNAARVVFHNAGIALSPRSGAVRISKAVSAILQNDLYKENARRLGERTVADAKACSVVSELEHLVEMNVPLEK